MNTFCAIPLEARLIVIFVVGACLGAAVNWAIYRLAWFSRAVSPWSPPDPSAPPRRWFDRTPIIGWLGLRREARLHGVGFWIRPMLLEMATAVGLAWLYGWQTAAWPTLPSELVLWRFLANALLIGLMLAASMIDVDEKIIPDAITIPGTLAGLALAAVRPESLLFDPFQLPLSSFLHIASPNPWPDRLNGFPNGWSLALGLACWWAWCAALLPRSWRRRHGWRRAVQLWLARIVRERVSYRLGAMAVLGSLVLAWIWMRGGWAWQGLLSSLVGVVVGGGLIWAVRIVGAAVLRREAMGFGDVTLMAMIGAFLGWQPCLVIFFLAPMAGLIVGLLRVVLFRDKEIPYGPFLCLAALFVIVRWDWIWERCWHVFELEWFVPLAMVLCLALMALMLGTWRLVRSLLVRLFR
ncbi:MAG: A24 family peptidase [Planctomycetaceae bacterium]|nr:A24 family peptidase [Planctomycetaceae bacterium]